MSYIVTDVDGTLTTTGDRPNLVYLDWLKSQINDFGTKIIVVSARPDSRLEETKAWLKEHFIPAEEVYLNDFPGAGQGPNVGIAFKRAKYEKLAAEYGDLIEFVVDNDADARAAAEDAGLDAITPEEAIKSTVADDENAVSQVPEQRDNEMYPLAPRQEGMETAYELIVDAFGKFNQGAGPDGAHYAPGDKNPFKGDGLMCSNCEFYEGPRGCELVVGDIDPEGICKLWVIPAALIPGEAPVAPENDAMSVVASEDNSADADIEERFDVKELETRALPMGDFAITTDETGQKTFTGYAALFSTASEGLPFTEVIAPGAFSRTLKRVNDARKIVSFLFGHDETRALATTASGRLRLAEDQRGLRVEAKLDPADPDAASVISKLTNEAMAMGMSFGFTIPKGGDSWEGDQRTLNEINLAEVSILSAGQTPAYPATLGLTAVRNIAKKRIGVDGDALVDTVEAIKQGKDLTEEQTDLLETIREKLGAKIEKRATWTVGASRDLQVVDTTWDGAGAAARVFNYAGFDTDSPDFEKARSAFLVYDADAPELRGSYKLGFADVVDGELVAVRAGLRAAASRLPLADISADAADRARAVLDAYFGTSRSLHPSIAAAQLVVAKMKDEAI